LKSFRIFLGEPTTPPQRHAADISSEEEAQLREVFSVSARGYRRSGRIAGFTMVGALVCVVLGLLLPKSMIGWTIGGFLLCWLAVVSISLLSARLLCPSCHNPIDGGFGTYCPECGARGLLHGGWLRAPHCSSCGRDLRCGKGRCYRIHVCTHCGLWLDDEGL
jgi:hypothetical protein